MGPTVHTKSMYIAIFTNNIWSYLLWPPAIDPSRDKKCKKALAIVAGRGGNKEPTWNIKSPRI